MSVVDSANPVQDSQQQSLAVNPSTPSTPATTSSVSSGREASSAASSTASAPSTAAAGTPPPASSSTATTPGASSSATDSSSSSQQTNGVIPSEKRKKRRKKWAKNDVPEILRNMPSGATAVFGTSDNSTRKFRRRRSPPREPLTQQQKDQQAALQSSSGQNVSLSDRAAFGPTNPGGKSTATAGSSGVGGRFPMAGQRPNRSGPVNLFNAEYYGQGTSPSLSTTNVYVGGIPRHFTEKEMYAVFSAYGKLSSVYITRAGTVAFVQFENGPDAQNAINGQNQVIPPTGKWPWIVKFANFNSMVSQRQTAGSMNLNSILPSAILPPVVVPPNPNPFALSNITRMT